VGVAERQFTERTNRNRHWLSLFLATPVLLFVVFGLFANSKLVTLQEPLVAVRSATKNLPPALSDVSRVNALISERDSAFGAEAKVTLELAAAQMQLTLANQGVDKAEQDESYVEKCGLPKISGAAYVFFGTSNDELTPTVEHYLARFVAGGVNGPLGKVVAHGYSDSRGSATFNQSLSEHRANIVAVAIKKLASNPDKIPVVGHGGACSLRRIKDSQEVRLACRRVVVLVPTGRQSDLDGICPVR
jgi:outer membrane protein OmpA-like peptidoglycan-associated protein